MADETVTMESLPFEPTAKDISQARNAISAAAARDVTRANTDFHFEMTTLGKELAQLIMNCNTADPAKWNVIMGLATKMHNAKVRNVPKPDIDILLPSKLLQLYLDKQSGRKPGGRGKGAAGDETRPRRVNRARRRASLLTDPSPSPRRPGSTCASPRILPPPTTGMRCSCPRRSWKARTTCSTLACYIANQSRP